METNDLVFSVFEVPPGADAPIVSPDVYADWICQNIQRLREAGRLDDMCAARSPVNARFKFSDAS